MHPLASSTQPIAALLSEVQPAQAGRHRHAGHVAAERVGAPLLVEQSPREGAWVDRCGCGGGSIDVEHLGERHLVLVRAVERVEHLLKRRRVPAHHLGLAHAAGSQPRTADHGGAGGSSPRQCNTIGVGVLRAMDDVAAHQQQIADTELGSDRELLQVRIDDAHAAEIIVGRQPPATDRVEVARAVAHEEVVGTRGLPLQHVEGNEADVRLRRIRLDDRHVEVDVVEVVLDDVEALVVLVPWEVDTGRGADGEVDRRVGHVHVGAHRRLLVHLAQHVVEARRQPADHVGVRRLRVEVAVVVERQLRVVVAQQLHLLGREKAAQHHEPSGLQIGQRLELHWYFRLASALSALV